MVGYVGLSVKSSTSDTKIATDGQAAAQTRALLVRRLPGARRGTIAAHLPRAERIGAAIWRRWQVGPYRWQLKHLRWYLTTQTGQLAPGTRYRYWLTVRALVLSLGHDTDWLARLDRPWVRPTAVRRALMPGRPAARLGCQLVEKNAPSNATYCNAPSSGSNLPTRDIRHARFFIDDHSRSGHCLWRPTGW